MILGDYSNIDIRDFEKITLSDSKRILNDHFLYLNRHLFFNDFNINRHFYTYTYYAKDELRKFTETEKTEFERRMNHPYTDKRELSYCLYNSSVVRMLIIARQLRERSVKLKEDQLELEGSIILEEEDWGSF